MLQERCWCSDLDQFSSLQKRDLLRAGKGIIAVSNDQYGALVYQAFQCLTDKRLAFRIKTGF